MIDVESRQCAYHEGLPLVMGMLRSGMIDDGFVGHVHVVLDRPGLPIAADDFPIKEAVFILGVEGEIFRIIFEIRKTEILKGIYSRIQFLAQINQAFSRREVREAARDHRKCNSPCER